MKLQLPSTRTFPLKNRQATYLLSGFLIACGAALLVLFVLAYQHHATYGSPAKLPWSNLISSLWLFMLSALGIHMTRLAFLKVSAQGVELSACDAMLTINWENIDELVEISSKNNCRYLLRLKEPVHTQHKPKWWPVKGQPRKQVDITTYLREIDYREFKEYARQSLENVA